MQKVFVSELLLVVGDAIYQTVSGLANRIENNKEKQKSRGGREEV